MKMIGVSPVWKGIVEEWDRLCDIMDIEKEENGPRPSAWKRSAALLEDIIDRGEKLDVFYWMNRMFLYGPVDGASEHLKTLLDPEVKIGSMRNENTGDYLLHVVLRNFGSAPRRSNGSDTAKCIGLLLNRGGCIGWEVKNNAGETPLSLLPAALAKDPSLAAAIEPLLRDGDDAARTLVRAAITASSPRLGSRGPR